MARKDKVKGKIENMDWVVIIATPIIASLVTIIFNTNQIISLLLFFVFPALYLNYRNPRITKKILIYLLASIPFTIIIDYFAIKDGSWWVYSIFPIRFLNGIPIEDFIWSASWFYYVIAFYEYFVDTPKGGRDTPLNKKYKKMLGFWFGGLALFFLLYFFIDNLAIPYFYASFAIILGVIPLIIFLTKHPKMLYKFTLVVIYFFVVNFLHEISALSAGQWYFPGTNFIGWVEVFQFRFPFEEFVLWMLLGSSYVLTWYEYFEDDSK